MQKKQAHKNLETFNSVSQCLCLCLNSIIYTHKFESLVRPLCQSLGTYSTDWRTDEIIDLAPPWLGLLRFERLCSGRVNMDHKVLNFKKTSYFETCNHFGKITQFWLQKDLLYWMRNIAILIFLIFLLKGSFSCDKKDSFT